MSGGFSAEAYREITGSDMRNAQNDEEKLNTAAFEAGAITEAAKEKLKQVVDRIENLIEDKKEVADQIKDVYAEAKSMGYDTKVIRALIAERAKDAEELKELEALKDIYRLALDMQD